MLKTIIKYFLFLPLVSAQALQELPATPNIISEPQASLHIVEVNFNNPEQDWVLLHYESPTAKPINLKGISFADDKIFKTIEEDFIVASGQQIILTFKSSKTDTMPYLFTSRTGLTATTEQFIIKDRDGTVLDAVCWASQSPAAAEMSDMAELFEDEGWHSPEPGSCIASEPVKKYMSIQRLPVPDTNTAADWRLFDPNATEATSTTAAPTSTASATPAAAQEAPLPNNVETVKITTPKSSEVNKTAAITQPAHHEETDEEDSPILEDPDLVNLQKPSAPAKTPTKSTKKSSSSSKSGSSSSKTSYKDGDLSNSVIITEIMPNPEGTDTGNEWIEITNLGKDPVNLGNWQLDDEEGGSKPYPLSDAMTIEPGQAIVIPSSDSKISLGNTQESARLFDPVGELVSEQAYEGAPSGESFARLTIENQDGDQIEEWSWTKEPTPGEPNPSLFEITASIMEDPIFAENYSFLIGNDGETPHTVLFSEGVIPAPLAKTTLIKGTKATFIVKKLEDGTLELVRYQILSPPTPDKNQNSALLPTILISLAAIGAAGFLLLKKIKWPKTKV